MGSDAIALNFSNKLDSTDCSIWVLERSIFKSDMMISWFLTILKEFLEGLLLLKPIFFS